MSPETRSKEYCRVYTKPATQTNKTACDKHEDNLPYNLLFKSNSKYIIFIYKCEDFCLKILSNTRVYYSGIDIVKYNLKILRCFPYDAFL